MKESTRKLIKSVVSDLVGLAAAMPLILQSVNINTAAGWGATLVAAAAGVTRIMAIPQVETIVDRVLGAGPK